METGESLVSTHLALEAQWESLSQNKIKMESNQGGYLTSTSGLYTHLDVSTRVHICAHTHGNTAHRKNHEGHGSVETRVWKERSQLLALLPAYPVGYQVTSAWQQDTKDALRRWAYALWVSDPLPTRQ